MKKTRGKPKKSTVISLVVILTLLLIGLGALWIGIGRFVMAARSVTWLE